LKRLLWKHSSAFSILLRYWQHNETDLGLLLKCPDVFVRFQQNLEFIDKFSYKCPVSNLTKIRTVNSADTYGQPARRKDRYNKVSSYLSFFLPTRLNTWWVVHLIVAESVLTASPTPLLRYFNWTVYSELLPTSWNKLW
jgi:hypothetical protein